ncbi:hypothetical protein M9H77_19892 [Catharanthus roseus]|uniref:UDP glycosyltransferase 9 n=2 Tax=Catharanthus roseus TaxID=4058 RepID=UGT9_CATRO|nr:RecName: Full=UDP glycosyltransferase 9; Short=CrUGT9 [Catharanthus roseus]AHK60847.1 CrUGT9 [Catharanthus roseus]KAI5670039.1 hypothetical protein M9H77_19892 [Catharanthus roseus]
MGTIDIITSPTPIHILAFPFPAKGHINPLLHLCNRLASKGFKITLITTVSTLKSVKTSKANGIDIESIPDGIPQEQNHQIITVMEMNMELYFKQFKASAIENTTKLIQKLKTKNPPPKVLIYDSSMPWILEVAHEQGLLGASFFTQPCSVSAIYYHMLQGTIKLPLENSENGMVSLPYLPLLEKKDLPGVQQFEDNSEALAELLADQFSNIDDVDYVLFNTFDALEIEVVNWMGSKWPILTVGPTAPTSMFLLDKKQKNYEDGRSINYLFETNTEVCMKWLDQREIDTVIYVSFGSLASLTEEQMEQVSQALIRSNCYFLWVVREEEENKLPKDFKETTSKKKGLVINWCPQLDVLAHKSVACFMTHCGWNSTLEALCSGVPMICMPQWADQTTNAKLIEHVWKIGVGVNKSDENGIVKREDIEDCIRQVIESERGKELKRNAIKWKELAKEAVSEGGSSYNNIQEFSSSLLFN